MLGDPQNRVPSLSLKIMAPHGDRQESGVINWMLSFSIWARRRCSSEFSKTVGTSGLNTC